MAKFFKTTVVVTVISQDNPPQFDGLNDLHYHITDGECSGDFTTDTVEITAKQAAKLAVEQGSDPTFFGIDENGKKID